jgi:hypothetical protein
MLDQTDARKSVFGSALSVVLVGSTALVLPFSATYSSSSVLTICPGWGR